MTSLSDPSPLSVPHRSLWPWLSAALWLALLLWIVAGWAAVAGHWSLGYAVDGAATLLMAAPLALAAGLATRQAQRHALAHAQDAHKQWLSVLLVKRDQAELAADALEVLRDSLARLSDACRPPDANGADAPAVGPASEATRWQPDLLQVVAQEDVLRPLTHAVRARLINLQVRIGRGDPLESLSFEIQPLADEFQQIERTLQSLFQQVDTLVKACEAPSAPAGVPDPLADLRPWVHSAIDEATRVRELLASTLDQPLPPAPSTLDEALGLTRDHG